MISNNEVVDVQEAGEREQWGGIGINGMGRIGRLVLRIACSKGSGGQPLLPVRAINSLYPAETIAHLLKYDSVHGKYDADIAADRDTLLVDGNEIAVTYERDPASIPWKSLGVRTVVEATGKFTDRDGAALHLQAGARNVVVTAPGKGMDATIVRGVNEHTYSPADHRLVSTASCTTNCVAPVLDVLDRSFGVEEGWVTAVHAYTGDQRHLDNPHEDLRRSRGCTQSIVPTTTGIGKALAHVLPHLSSSIHGLSLRVPVADVSIADMTLTVRKEASAGEVRDAFRALGELSSIIGYTDEPLVSADFLGRGESAVIDGLSVHSVGRKIKLLAWYDNEWGYANRVADMAAVMARMDSDAAEGEELLHEREVG